MTENFPGHTLDSVAGDRARRKTFGHDDTESGVRSLIGFRVQDEMRGSTGWAQTKNG